MEEMKKKINATEEEQLETQEWLDSIDYVIANSGSERVCDLLQEV
jgi:pyruvate dehydrogenase complex dehydrogenase (E1) component